MSDLIVAGMRIWDEEAARIRSLLLGEFEEPDLMAWRFTRDGVYSAKSGYFYVLKGQEGSSRLQIGSCYGI